MTIICTICKRAFSSTKPKEAQADVMEQMVKHVTKDHPKEATVLAEDVFNIHRALSTYLLLKRHVRIPESETAMQKSFDENEASLLELFDVEPEPQTN